MARTRITPAFGYGAPHPGARETSTLLNNVLFSTHYGRSDSYPLRRASARPFARDSRSAPRGQVSLIHPLGLPTIPPSNTCGRSASSGQGTLSYRGVNRDYFPTGLLPNRTRGFATGGQARRIPPAQSSSVSSPTGETS